MSDVPFYLDTSRLTITPDSIAPVLQWVDGKRSDVQAVDDKGVPIWMLEVTWKGKRYGRGATGSAEVYVPSSYKPDLGEDDAFRLVDLSELSRVRAGQLRSRVEAEGIAPKARVNA